jgi:transcriptional regulator with XRE-family HTH domain
MNTVISKRIQELRIRRGLSQEELADRLSTSQNQISRYETGKNQPTGEVIISLAHELETTADYLLGLIDVPERPLFSSNDLTQLERELIEVLRRRSNQHNLEDLVNFLKAVG